MIKQKKIGKIVLCISLASILAVTAVFVGTLPDKVADVMTDTVTADAAAGSTAGIKIESELTTKRSKFTKQFTMTDGSFTAVTYSMPVHYKKNGKWKEINTTLKKSGKKNYKTKSTALKIKVAKKANKKSLISLKRGKNSLSIALQGKNLKARGVKISNPKKKAETDVLNQNKVVYKKVLKNTNVSYDIFPEKIQEIVSVTKKQKCKSLSFKIDSGKLKVQVKGKKIYFKTKKGKTKYTRLSTRITDANGASTTNVKLSYNEETGVLKVTPDKKWWNSKKRKFPMEIRTTYITDKHSRDVKVGAAYAGAPNSNFGYDKSLLLQANKCVAFTKMTNLAELNKPNVQIRDAALHVKSEKTLKLGAGKTFDISVHKVKQGWKVYKLTYNNRPSYEPGASATFGIQKKGNYQCDITDIVKAWYAGEANYGVALVADNSNRSYQAELDRNPYFTVHYEVVGFDGAVQLKEGQNLTRQVLRAGQENYYYFDVEPNIAYELYSSGSMDTQATLYDSKKNRLGYDDNGGLGNNFLILSAHNGRRYVKVSTKGSATGSYTLTLKKRFTIPEPVGTRGQDGYTISWNPVANAKEYIITIYDANGVIGTAVTTQSSYEYVFTADTIGKTLAFTVTPRESKDLVGEPSRKIYTSNSASEWSYDVPMLQGRERFASATYDNKIYVLGGADSSHNTVLKTMEVFDTEKQVWSKLADYPGNVAGICDAAMVEAGGKLYVLGGQTSVGTSAKTLKEVYCYNPAAGTWSRLADMPQSRTGLLATVCDGKIYTFAKAGSTERVDIYDPIENSWTSDVKASTSINIQAQTVDGRIFVLQEKTNVENELQQQMYFAEYLLETGEYDNAGTACSQANANRYVSGTVVNGKIYIICDNETDQVICYDAYLDTWSSLSVLNLKKQYSKLQSVGNTLYSLGGFLQGFGTLDVMESYSLEATQIVKQLEMTEGEAYELQINAGNCEEDTDYFVTVRIDPSVLAFTKTSSFMQKEEIKKGKEGIQLVHYAPEKGVMVLKLRGKMETGETFQAYQSIPVTGKKDGITTVQMAIEKK